MFTVNNSGFCVGLDPSTELLRSWGLDEDVRGLEAFGEIVITALQLAPAPVKLQAAFYEQHGARGIAELQRIIRNLSQSGCPVILDAKRGDIASTAAAYARAWMGMDSTSPVHGITVVPWLGLDALAPFFELARGDHAVVFVVVRSSNPDGAPLQLARQGGGESNAEWLCDAIAQINRDGLCAGAVLGATQRKELAPLLDRLNGAPALTPGVGAQGTRMDELAQSVGHHYSSLIVPMSRHWMMHGPDPKNLAQATLDFQRQDAALRSYQS
ncbi:MAG: orotidine-5'-phosphate decarboxylase [Gammaproteobacteria bacterium AqS3]|nr:orotidine-5'-phosphate decarboxylase [Gammaproteobacteria bacterium AqS3]